MGDKVEKRMVKRTQDEWPPSILDIQRGIYRFWRRAFGVPVPVNRTFGRRSCSGNRGTVTGKVNPEMEGKFFFISE